MTIVQRLIKITPRPVKKLIKPVVYLWQGIPDASDAVEICKGILDAFDATERRKNMIPPRRMILVGGGRLQVGWNRV